MIHHGVGVYILGHQLKLKIFPIQLSEEWLKKIGAVSISPEVFPDKTYKLHFPKVEPPRSMIFFLTEGIVSRIEFERDTNLDYHIPIHEIQNFYFDMNQEPFEIKGAISI